MSMKDAIKGKGAVGIAIGYFSLRGMVSLPLSPCAYNLLFDDGKKIQRIKVISCSFKSPYGVYMVNIRSMAENTTKQTYKDFDPDTCDYVFAVTDLLDMYNIPSYQITTKRTVSLSTQEEYRVKFGDVV